MRRGSRISLGPGAASLILIVVILSLSVLGILALMNARSDQQLSRRSISVIEAGYALGAEAEKSLASLDAVAASCEAVSADDGEYLDALRKNLPDGMLMDGRSITWSESDGLRTLDCEVEVMPLDAQARLEWRTHRLTAITEESWN